MKYLATILITILMASACARPKYYHQTINEIPTRAPNFNMDIRFAGQALPLNPYFEIVEINIVEPNKMDRRQVKKRLQEEAVREGLDGIVEVEAYAFVKYKANFIKILMNLLDPDAFETTSPVHHTEIIGIGIMYLDRMDFVRNLPEYERFYLVDRHNGTPTPLFRMEYRLTGQHYFVHPEGDSTLEIYNKYFKHYSDYHLLKQREGWTYKMNGEQLKERTRLLSSGHVDKRIIPVYNRKKQMVRIKIKYVNNAIEEDEYVQYTYDGDGRLKSKNVWVHDGATVYEEYEYEGDRIKRKKILIKRPGLEPMLLTTTIRFYHPDYLQDYYNYEMAGG